ncbi:MAG: sulfotransferase, partial [Sulfobacillus sp.]
MTNPESDNPPFLFIVGCGRSGTTLLVSMLDSHPNLAIPGESGGFILQIRDQVVSDGMPDRNLSCDEFVARVSTFSRFQAWNLDLALLRARLEP